MMQTFQTADFEHRIITGQGEVRYIHSICEVELGPDKQPIGLYGVSHDVTEARLAEQALVQSELNFRKIIDLMPQGIYVRDVAGNYLFANQAFADMMGMPISKIVGHNMADFYPDKEVVKLALTRDNGVFDKGTRQVLHDVKFTNVKLEERFVTIVKVPFQPVNYDQMAMLVIMTDVTGDKRIEAERVRMIQDISHRNNNLEQFSYIVSHNLRAPVANILGLTSLLSLEDLPVEEEHQMLQYLQTACEGMDTVIKDLNQILDINGMLSEHRTLINFNCLLEEVEIGLELTIKRENVRIISDFTAAESIDSLRSYLYSIFYNLISKGIKYRRPGVDPVITIATKKVGKKIEIRFQDNGLGIDLQKAGDRLFGLYKRIHVHTEGRGVGLYLVKTQVEALGGRISVDSTPGQGTEFIIELPGQDS
jgi:PAS domain S-box-containing protein